MADARLEQEDLALLDVDQLGHACCMVGSSMLPSGGNGKYGEWEKASLRRRQRRSSYECDQEVTLTTSGWLLSSASPLSACVMLPIDHGQGLTADSQCSST